MGTKRRLHCIAAISVASAAAILAPNVFLSVVRAGFFSLAAPLIEFVGAPLLSKRQSNVRSSATAATTTDASNLCQFELRLRRRHPCPYSLGVRSLLLCTARRR